MGRLASYSLYVGAASAAHQSVAKLFRKGFTSPQAIAVQLIALVVLVVVVRVDWPSAIDKLRAWWAARRGRPKPRPIRETLMSNSPENVSDSGDTAATPASDQSSVPLPK